MRISSFPVFLVSLCFVALPAAAASLPHSVIAELKRAHIPLSGTAIVVREVGSRKPLIQVNAQRPMNPASTMKLLTTYAALDLLGAAYTWKTEAYLDGELKEGVLHGNLVLKGYGNPKFTIEQFWLWLSELRARGLRDIRGDLILDRSHFDLPPHDPAEFDNDPLRAYNVGPDALLLNFNVLRLRYLPEAQGLRIISEPALQGVHLNNQLRPSERTINCKDWDEYFSVQPNGDSVVLQGNFPVECGEREQNLNVMPHTRYVEAVFRALWQELGGTLSGQQRDGGTPASAQLYSTHRSEPLSAIIRDINKFSNNVMARQLFLTLGEADATWENLARNAAPDMPLTTLNIERSIFTLRSWLARRGLTFPELTLENGAGLSRVERISAAHMADLLQDASDHPLSAELQSSLPILGIDGSVKGRLTDSAARSHAHLKTGTLEGVKAIAGYVRSHSGKEWIVVFNINHPYAKHGTAAQDALLEWIQQR